MAHGFRHVPRQRTASEPDPDSCPWCHVPLTTGPRRHLCKEVTYGTAVPPASMIPFDDSHPAAALLRPYTHRLVLPATEEEMRAMPPAAFTLRDGTP